MTTLTELEDIQPALKKYMGYNAQMWLYSVSLRRIVFRLYQNGLPDSDYILLVGCSYIKGSLDCKNVNLKIDKTENTNGPFTEYRLYDDNIGLEIISHGGVGLIIDDGYGMEGLFDNFHFGG
jgi:hypothetical protein